MSDSEDELFKKKKPSKKKLEQQQKQQQQQQIQQQQKQLKQENDQQQNPKHPKLVIYCRVCTLPVEFCQYSKAPQECKEWLKTTFKDLYAKLYPEEIKIQQEKEAAQQQQQEQQKQQELQQAAATETKKKKKLKIKESEMVYIKVKERNRNKFITTITGLDKHGLDIEETQKKISKKFGCGSSLNEKGEIQLQGDLSAELEEWLPKEYPSIKEDMIAIQEK